MVKALGMAVHDGLSVTEPSDGTGSAGDFVTLNASGQVTPVSTTDDDIYGVLADTNDMGDVAAGDTVDVHKTGIVIGNAAGAVAKGDVVQPEGTNAGRVASNAQGTTHSVDEGGTAIYDLAPANPIAQADAGGTYQGGTLGANATAVRLR